MRGIFGWSLPPGVTNRMIDEQCEEGPCAVCGRSVDDCICPECSVCGNVGDPKCYGDHGMVPTMEQITSLEKMQAAERQENAILAKIDADEKEG